MLVKALDSMETNIKSFSYTNCRHVKKHLLFFIDKYVGCNGAPHSNVSKIDFMCGM